MPLSRIGSVVSERNQLRSSQCKQLANTLVHSIAAALTSSFGGFTSRLQKMSSVK
jgi:hypothetical protein